MCNSVCRNGHFLLFKNNKLRRRLTSFIYLVTILWHFTVQILVGFFPAPWLKLKLRAFGCSSLGSFLIQAVGNFFGLTVCSAKERRKAEPRGTFSDLLWACLNRRPELAVAAVVAPIVVPVKPAIKSRLSIVSTYPRILSNLFLRKDGIGVSFCPQQYAATLQCYSVFQPSGVSPSSGRNRVL